MAHANKAVTVLKGPEAQLQEYLIKKRMGTRAERRFRKICRRFLPKAGCPKWLLRIVPATGQEDADGTDFFAETVEARIPIDVKASQSAADHFKWRMLRRGKDHSHVILLIVDESAREFEIWCTMIAEVSEKRLELLAQRAAAE